MIRHWFAFFLVFCVVIISCAGKPAPREPVPGEAAREETFQDQEADSPAEATPDVPETITIPDPPPEKEAPINLIEPEIALADTEKTASQAAVMTPSLLPEPTPRLAQENPQPQTETVAAAPPPAVPPPAPVTPPSVAQNPPSPLAAPPPAPVTPPPVTQNQPPTVAPPPAPVTPPPVTQNQPPPVAPPPAPTTPPPVQEAALESEQPSAEAETQEQENAADEEIIFSRIVRATVGQLVEIPFRGSGWVYLGELGAQRGIEYRSRRLDPEGQSFIFQIEAAGTYTLKFYKQDFIRNYILNDHVQVIAGQAPEAGSGWFNPPLDRGRVIAEPRWPTSLEEAELARNGGRPPARETPADTPPPETPPLAPAEPAQPAPPSGESAPAQPTPPPAPRESAPTQPVQTPAPAAPTAGLGPATPPNIFLQKAQEEFDAGKVASAIAILDQFTGYYPSGSDEAYWLYGQFYEANSPSRDILTALDYYRRLTREYPQSSRYNDARRRIAYLERFYINIQ